MDFVDAVVSDVIVVYFIAGMFMTYMVSDPIVPLDRSPGPRTDWNMTTRRYTTGKMAHCVRWHGDTEKPNEFLSGMANKKIVQWVWNGYVCVCVQMCASVCGDMW